MGGASEEDSTSSNNNGETGCSRETGCASGTCNSDDTNQNIQPDECIDSKDKSLKKARYVWQIKGNYHLKCPVEDNISNLEPKKDVENSELEASSSSHTMDNKASQNSIDSKGDTGTVTVETECPSGSAHKRTSPVWYRPRPDWPVLKWQTRQVAKAFVDNTINCVLEDMGFVPLPADSDDILDEDFSTPSRDQNSGNLEDEAVLMAIQSHGLQRSDHDSKVENVKIDTSRRKERIASYHCENSDLLQIQQSFLRTTSSVPGDKFCSSSRSHSSIVVDPAPVSSKQNESGCSSLSLSQQDTCDFETSGINHFSTGGNESKGECANEILTEFSPLCSCPVRHLSDPKELPLKPFHQRNVQTSLENGGENRCTRVWCCDNVDSSPSHCACYVNKKTVHQDPLKRKPQDPVFSDSCKKQCTSNDVPSLMLMASQSLDTDSATSTSSRCEGKAPSYEHFDFMDAAVAAAIQKKGLSALACTEYG